MKLHSTGMAWSGWLSVLLIPFTVATKTCEDSKRNIDFTLKANDTDHCKVLLPCRANCQKAVQLHAKPRVESIDHYRGPKDHAPILCNGKIIPYIVAPHEQQIFPPATPQLTHHVDDQNTLIKGTTVATLNGPAKSLSLSDKDQQQLEEKDRQVQQQRKTSDVPPTRTSSQPIVPQTTFNSGTYSLLASNNLSLVMLSLMLIML